MKIGEKIMILRKEKDLSQEDLSMLMDVSRQSVSKWELGDSTPDLDKIIRLAEIFNVSTDELIRDDLPLKQSALSDRLSDEEAEEFIALRHSTALPLAGAVMLCILSPVCLLAFGGGFEAGFFHKLFRSEDTAGLTGLVILLGLITIAVAIFIYLGQRLSKFDYLSTTPISISSRIRKQAEAALKEEEKSNAIGMTAGICLTIFAVIVFFLILMAGEQYSGFGVAAMLTIIALGVFLIIMTCYRKSTWQILLQEGDYTVENKAYEKKYNWLPGVYWCVVTAIYLLVSFLTDAWDITWVIYATAGIIYGAIVIFLRRKISD